MKKKIFIIMLTGIAFLCLAACDLSFVRNQDQVDSTIDFDAMDTYMTLRAYGKNRKTALKAAKKEIERLDDMWSVGNSDSEVSRLNHTKEERVSDETLQLIVYAKEISKETGGAFDLTIYPLMDLWGFTTKQYRVPNKNSIQKILKTKVGMDLVSIEKKTNTVRLANDAEIDFGGIAKGFTSQSIVKIFEDYGIKSGIISLGGNIQAIGTKPDGSRWKVGIESPDEDLEMVGTYEAEDEAVITSGGYERYFEKDGKRYHHILDPKSGYPSESDLLSVTVISKDGTKADCLSTALFVLGKEKGIYYWKKHSDEFDFIFVDKKNDILISEGIQNHFKSEYHYDIVCK